MQTAVRSARRRREKGSALVEGALVLMVFLMVLFGLMDMGQFLFQRASVVERVRYAVREGVITYDPTTIRDLVLYGTDDPAEGAQPSFNLTAAMVDVQRLGTNTSADRVQVTVSNYPIDFYTPFLAGRITGPPILITAPMEVGNLP